MPSPTEALQLELDRLATTDEQLAQRQTELEAQNIEVEAATKALRIEVDELKAWRNSQQAPTPSPAPTPPPPELAPTGAAIDLSFLPFAFNRAVRPQGNPSPIVINVSQETFQVNTSDTIIEIPEGRVIDNLVFNHGIKRCWVRRSSTGGGFGTVRKLTVPTVTSAAQFPQDLVIDGIRLEPSASQYAELYALRLEVINCVGTGTGYFWYSGTHVPQYQDFLLANCDFTLNGDAQAAVRWEGITRGVCLNNKIRTGGRHCFRVHGVSDLVHVKGLQTSNANQAGNGIRLGAMSGVSAQVNRVWMKDVIASGTGPEDIDVSRDGSVTVAVCDNVWSVRPSTLWSAWEAVSGAPRTGWTITNSGRRFA